MRLEIVDYSGPDREKVYILEDAADLVLEASCVGEVSLRARDIVVVD